MHQKSFGGRRHMDHRGAATITVLSHTSQLDLGRERVRLKKVGVKGKGMGKEEKGGWLHDLACITSFQSYARASKLKLTKSHTKNEATRRYALFQLHTVAVLQIAVYV